MNCPKCGKELLNVNGKYLCVDCGIEVPETENNLSNAQATNGETVDDKELSLDDEAISPDASEVAEVAEVASLSPTEIPSLPDSINIPTTDESPRGKADETIDLPELPQELPQSNPMANAKPVDGSALISDLEGGSQPAVPLKEALPTMPIEEAAADTPQAGDLSMVDPPEIPEPSVAKDYPVAYPMESNQEAATQREKEVPFIIDEKANPAGQLGVETNNLTEPADLFEKKDPENLGAEPEGFNSVPPPPTLPPMHSFSQNTTDPAAIFQDPMYDNNSSSVPAQPVNHIVPAAVDPDDDDRKLKIILIVGIVGAVLLLIAGIIAYSVLT